MTNSAIVLCWGLGVAQVMLAVAMCIAAWRVACGPRAQDRVLGMDTLSLNALLLIVTFGIRLHTSLYFEAALIVGLLGFTTSVALAKFLMRGEVIE